MTATNRTAGLLRGLSEDPEARAKQLANLRPRAATKHGATSPAMLAPERERVLAELVQAFPGVRRDRLEIAAHKRARISLLQRYVDEVGVIRRKATGDIFPAVGLLQREETAYLAELAKLEALAAVSGESARRGTLEHLSAQLGEPEDAELAGEQEAER